MFLNQLNDGNKELFLKLCIQAALFNGSFEDTEKDLIYAYCREMNIPEVIPNEVESIEILISQLRVQAEEVEKNIITLEILGLVRSDGMYDTKERVFMDKVVEGLSVSADKLSNYNSLLEIYSAVLKELRTAVCE